MVALQPGDVVMVRTDQFISKRKVKDRCHDGGYVIVEQFGDWPVYKVKCPPSGKQRKHTYQILHRNHLMLVPSEDDSPHDAMHLQVAAAIVLNANIEAFLVRINSSQEPDFRLSLLTRQNREQTSHVWLNGEFHTKPWTQMESSPTEDEVSEPESASSGSEEEED